MEQILYDELTVAQRKLQEQKDQYEGYMANLHEIIRKKHSEIKLLESRPSDIVRPKTITEESLIYQYKLERLFCENKLLKSKRYYADSSTQTEYEESNELEMKSIFHEINLQLENVSLSIYEMIEQISAQTNLKISKQVDIKKEKITYILVALSELESLKTSYENEIKKLKTKKINLADDLKTLKVCYDDLLSKTISFEEYSNKKDRALGLKEETKDRTTRGLS